MSYQSRSARGGSRATPSTVCQKCLQRGHYSFECKAAAQERPYTSRPSRSQQLANPRLRPQITNKALQEDGSEKNAAASDSANRNARLTSSSRKEASLMRTSKRSRSSSHASSSVSTMSSRSSRSPSAQRSRNESKQTDSRALSEDGPYRSSAVKRRRRTSSISPGDGPYTTKHEDERVTRARKRSSSPQQRGRAMGRSREGSARGR